MDDFFKIIKYCCSLDEYIPTALKHHQYHIEHWQDYISSSNLKNSSSPHKENYSVPSSPYFLQNDNIVISFHLFNTIYDTTIEKNYFQHFHNHDFYEINYIYRGEVINYLPDQTVHQNKNQVLLMNPLAYHRPVVQSPDTVLFNIMIRKEFSSDILHSGSFSNSNLIHVFLDSSLGLTPLQPYLIFENTPDIALIIHQMIQEYYDQKPYYQQLLYADLMRLWSLFARQKDELLQKENLQKQYPEQMVQILSYLRNHYATTTLVDTAKKFGFASSYLSRYIQKYTGMKYNEIITQLKMQNAAGYLLHTNFSLEKIIELVGYNDTNYFIKAFKKYYGVAPGKYRNQNK